MQVKFKDGSTMIAGFLARDAEYKQVGQNNAHLTKFSVKVGERAVEGQDKPAPIWASCTCWNDLAKKCQNLKKFDTVLCIGRLQSHEGNDGKTYYELVCEYVNWTPRLDGVKEIAQRAKNNGLDVEFNDDDGDLPF